MRLYRVLACLSLALVCANSQAAAPDFADVDALFSKHCLDCHSVSEAEKGLVLEDFGTTMKGGESGAAILPGKSSESLLVKFLEGRSGKTGKNQFMPPGKAKKLEPAEIALIKAWIDAGALPSKEAARTTRELIVPKITPKVEPRQAIHALAGASTPKLIAVARYGEVELRDATSQKRTRALKGHRGHVNALAFTRDGGLLASAAGEPGLFGEVKLWNVMDGALLRTIEGHRDALYSVAISPDGQILATGSYDQKIKLWEVATGKEVRTLSGHNGAIYGLSFRPDGKVLASASGDRTVKLWEVSTGKRLDTLSQATKELYTIAFAPDGKRLVAGGVDNRIRLWQISASALEGSNALLESRFAHEGAILSLVYSSDGKALLSSAEDRTVKVWNAATLVERKLLETQPDLAPGLGFINNGQTIMVGRLDGTMGYYPVEAAR
jgi:hypothetical protein